MALALSVVIPAYNEEARLGSTLERVTGYLAARDLDWEVLVVDDGSTDGTAAVAGRFAARGVRLLAQPVNRGKGAALRRGVLESRGEKVVLCDADLSTPIEEIERLEPALADFPLVFGSRAAPEARITVHQPFYREWMGKCFNLLIRLLGVGGIRDTQCGFKLLRGDVARRLFAELTIERFAYDVELVVLARRAGYGIAEVGVTWANSRASRVDPLRDSLGMLRDVLRLRLRPSRRQGDS